MRPAQIGIIHDIDVIRFWRGDRAVCDHFDQCARRILHGADKNRQSANALRDQRTILCTVNPVRAVIRLGDHGRKSSAGKAQVHLIADLLQSSLDDRKGDGIDGHAAPPIWIIRLPSAPDVT